MDHSDILNYIDENKENIQNNIYLELCNKLKESYEKKGNDNYIAKCIILSNPEDFIQIETQNILVSMDEETFDNAQLNLKKHNIIDLESLNIIFKTSSTKHFNKGLPFEQLYDFICTREKEDVLDFKKILLHLNSFKGNFCYRLKCIGLKKL